ncbi:double-stranded RNA-specific adenosine deaminase-like [Gigantopelta aegis]|uniref:double-stranded RNA-specific adenosine deaminase-like n=1 Tax=Gigantopelta aegis TaxID=1735272 RepID=UPI001B88C400|nr:double-stranded RNA-specific adenosine deaminase-like [Gigantopelta aegis]
MPKGHTMTAGPWSLISSQYGDRDPVSVLMEYGQTKEVTVEFTPYTKSGPDHNACFHTACIVDNVQHITGSGSSKKLAKKEAAEKALKTIYDRGKKKLKEANFAMNEDIDEQNDLIHAHKICILVRGVLEQAEETQLIYYSKEKISAAIALEMHHGKIVVVGLGTGNRCILSPHLPDDGSRIIHSHAEMIARRAFVRYLYKQLERYVSTRGHHLFEPSETGKLKLRDDVRLHLYISRPPCGDASAFPTIGNGPTRMKALRKQGQLRTLIEDGEGAIPTDSDVPPWENGNERMRVMTCSDKICRWNALGLQGALLSHFLDPIYLSSVIIGSFAGDQREHIPRAVFGRLKSGHFEKTLPYPYRVNAPDIFYPEEDLHDSYSILKSRQYLVNWTFGDAGVEVLDGVTGAMVGGPVSSSCSRLSKKSFFDQFHSLCERFERRDLAGLTYSKAKRMARDYSRTKEQLYEHFESCGYGPWYSVRDNYDVDEFQ